MVDNSQGHSAYPPDTLHVSQMNLNPGGAKAKMWDGWFIHNRQRVSQLMVFPKNHLKHPGEPKGMKQVLSERGLWQNGLLLICENKKNKTLSWMVNVILKQPTVVPHEFFHCSLISRNRNLLFKKPLRQQDIFVFSPEISLWVEPHWVLLGKKKYLWDHCDYTYDRLRVNIPKALASVQLSTIQKWEHCMIW